MTLAITSRVGPITETGIGPMLAVVRRPKHWLDHPDRVLHSNEPLGHREHGPVAHPTASLSGWPHKYDDVM